MRNRRKQHSLTNRTNQNRGAEQSPLLEFEHRVLSFAYKIF